MSHANRPPDPSEARQHLRDRLFIFDPGPLQQHPELARLRPDTEGRYAWDRWQAVALEAGLSRELAQLGREVMREAVQHDWNEPLKAECGWRDAGQAMLAQALAAGDQVDRRWRYLIQTDGERGCWTPEGDWESWT